MSTPVRPDRLTFPPDHQEPDLSRSDDGCQNDIVPPNERPGSRRFKSFVHRDRHGVNSPWFVGNTHTIHLEHHSSGNRRRSLLTRHDRCHVRINHPHLHNTKPAVLTTMHTLATHINTAKLWLCHPLQHHDATPWRCRTRRQCSHLRSLFLGLCTHSPRP